MNLLLSTSTYLSVTIWLTCSTISACWSVL